MAMADIEIKNLSFSYGAGEILKGVGFSLFPGDFVSIIGPNGAGKTTLLKNLNRILEGGRGEILIRGREIGRYRQKELAVLIAYVPQIRSPEIPFTVDELVLQGRYPHLSPFSTISQEDRMVAHRVIERVGIESMRNRHVSSLSGGEAQKAFIAAALAQEAPILLLDEPTAFLDPKHQKEVFDLLSDLNSIENISIVTVTHDINLAVLYSSRILALKDGELLTDCSPSDIMNVEELKRIFSVKFALTEHPETGMKIALPGVVKTENSN